MKLATFITLVRMTAMFSTPSFSDSIQAQPFSTEVSFLQSQSPLEVEGKRPSTTYSYEAEWKTEQVFRKGTSFIHKITTNYGKNFTDPPLQQDTVYLSTALTPIFEYDNQDNLLKVSLAQKVVRTDARDPESFKIKIPIEGYEWLPGEKVELPGTTNRTPDSLGRIYDFQTGDIDWLGIKPPSFQLKYGENNQVIGVEPVYEVYKLEDYVPTGRMIKQFQLEVPEYQKIGYEFIGKFTLSELAPNGTSPYLDPKTVTYPNLVYSWTDGITSNTLKGTSLAGATRVTQWDLMSPSERAIAKAQGLSPNPMAPQASPPIPPSIQEPSKPSNRVVIPIGMNEVQVMINDLYLDKEASPIKVDPKQIIPIGTNEVKVIVPSSEALFQTLEERSEPTKSFSPSSLGSIDLSLIAPSNISTTPIQLGDVEFWRRLEKSLDKGQGSSNSESLKMEIQFTEV